MKKVIGLAAVACLLSMTLGAALAYANGGTPDIPHAFYGNVTVNGAAAPVGTSVEARGEGVLTGIAGNPLTVSTAGKYGGAGALDPKLVVQGNITPGTILTFYVNGVSTGQTATWQSGVITQLNLAVTIAAPPPPAMVTVLVTFFGMTKSFLVDSAGIVQDTVVLVSPDGRLTVTILKGTRLLAKDGTPLRSLTIDFMATPPAPPKDTALIGLAYDFRPDGATFDPAIIFAWYYGGDTLPEHVAEVDLAIAFHDGATGPWVKCPSVVDVDKNIVTGQVAHFCCFGLLGTIKPPVEVPVTPPKEEVPPPEVEEEVPEKEAPPPEVKEKEEPEKEAPPPEVKDKVPEKEREGINWAVVGGIIGGVIVLAALIGYVWYRRHAYD